MVAPLIVSIDNFDCAVPDAPAFKLLEDDPNSILRPGTRRQIAAMVSEANPRNLAIECAPFLLARDGEISRSEYLKKRPLYNLRLSLGTRTPEGQSTRVAVGLRLSLLDSNDPYVDRELVAAAALAARNIQELRTAAQDTIRTRLGSPRALAELSSERREFMIDSASGDLRRAAEQTFEQARAKLKSEWNRNLLEVGLALAGIGSDSSARAVHATAYGAWLTGGVRVGAKGQLLIGGHGRLGANSTTGAIDRGEGAAAMRFYYGSSAAKAAVSADLGWKKHALPAYAGDLGTELRLIQSIWTDIAVGLAKEGSAPARITTRFSLRYSLPVAIPGADKLK